MTVNEILYSLEHDLIPKAVFEDTKTFIGVLAQKPDALYEFANELFRRDGQENPFGPGQFTVEPNMINPDVAMLKLKFPKPPVPPLCSMALIFFDRTFKKVSCFCMEKANDSWGNFPEICSWEADGTHVNYGNESPDPDEQVLKCLGIHMERYYPK